MAGNKKKLLQALERYTATKDRSRRFQVTIVLVAAFMMLFAIGRILYLLF